MSSCSKPSAAFASADMRHARRTIPARAPIMRSGAYHHGGSLFHAEVLGLQRHSASLMATRYKVVCVKFCKIGRSCGWSCGLTHTTHAHSIERCGDMFIGPAGRPCCLTRSLPPIGFMTCPAALRPAGSILYHRRMPKQVKEKAAELLQRSPCAVALAGPSSTPGGRSVASALNDFIKNIAILING
ncbi:hypothetical protein FHT71_003231 [Rhizobium sp. BK060]|nr:hypothetical protein [Rhizobium sp. BK060]